MTLPAQNTENQPQSSEKELNFRAMQAKYERELETERRARLQAEEKAASYEKSKQSSQRDEEDDVDDQPYVDQRALNKKLSKFEQNLERKFDALAEEKATKMVEKERQANYLRQNPDFNHMMSQDNLQKFAEKYPGIAENIVESTPEGFGRQKLVYQTMKDLGIGRKEEPKVNIQDVIEKNKQTPFYHPSSYATPSYQGQKGDFSEAGQKAAYEKMQALIKGRRT